MSHTFSPALAQQHQQQQQHGGHGHSHGGSGGGGGGGSHGHSHGGGPPQMPMPSNVIEAAISGSMSIFLAFFDDNSVHMTDRQGASALHWASLEGHLPIMRFLLDNGAPLNAKDNHQQTPLHYAATSNKVAAIHLLLDAGFDAYARDANNNTPHGSAAVNKSLASLHALHARAKMPTDLADSQGNTPLAWGAYMGHLGIIRYCNEVCGVPAKTFGKFGRSPLHWAAREGHLDCCIHLMSLGLDPAQDDEEGFSAIRYAQDRNHYECHAALKARVTSNDRNFSTFRAFLNDKRHLLRVLALIAYVGVCYVALKYVPPVAIIPMLVGYVGKNALSSTGRSMPRVMHREEPNIRELAGIPDTFEEAYQGPKFMFCREAGAVFALPIAIGLELVNLHPAVDGVIPMSVFYSLLFAKVFASATKLLSSRDIMPSGSTAEFPLWEAVEKGQYEDIKAGSDIFDSRVMLRKPARAFYCEQLGVVVRRFDSWCNTIDCALSHANMRWYMFFLASIILSQLFILRAGWDAAMVRYGCEASASLSSSGGGQHQQQQHGGTATGTGVLGWCATIGSLLAQGTPCPHQHSWLGGVAYSKLTWSDLLLAADTSRMDTMVILVPLILMVSFSILFGKCFLNAMSSASSAEVQQQECPCQDGGMMPLRKGNNMYGSVFGEGSPGANILLFFLGKDGERWEGVVAMPPGSFKKVIEPHRLVLPQVDHKKKHKR